MIQRGMRGFGLEKRREGRREGGREGGRGRKGEEGRGREREEGREDGGVRRREE